MCKCPGISVDRLFGSSPITAMHSNIDVCIDLYELREAFHRHNFFPHFFVARNKFFNTFSNRAVRSIVSLFVLNGMKCNILHSEVFWDWNLGTV